MMENKLSLGIIGLGKMGSHLALQCGDRGIAVIGKTLGKNEELEKQGIKLTDNYEDFTKFLKQPRAIYLSLPAGRTVDKVLDELIPYLDKGDVIMDGGNSFYRDSIDREKRISEKGIYFLDTGTSGGISGAGDGACFMVGGKEEGIRIVHPFSRSLRYLVDLSTQAPPARAIM